LARAPLKDRPLAFIDTETTGLDPRLQEVIEVAVLTERPDGTLDEWCTKVKPVRLETADPYALRINGYTAHPELWTTAPTFAEIASELTSRLDGTILVGHNVGFDLDFLQEGLIRCGSKVKLPYHKLDTVSYAYEHLVPKGLTSLSLDAIREFLGWPKDGAHTALVDARDCRRLFREVTGRG
jgi:DNA polymerase III epsilon subunit-like protein